MDPLPFKIQDMHTRLFTKVSLKLIKLFHSEATHMTSKVIVSSPYCKNG